VVFIGHHGELGLAELIVNGNAPGSPAPLDYIRIEGISGAGCHPEAIGVVLDPLVGDPSMSVAEKGRFPFSRKIT